MKPKSIYQIRDLKVGEGPNEWIYFDRLDYPVESITVYVTPGNPSNSSYNPAQGSYDQVHWFPIDNGNFWFDPDWHGPDFNHSTLKLAQRNQNVPFIRVGTYLVTYVKAYKGRMIVRVNFA